MKKLIGCLFVFVLGVVSTLGYLAWRDREATRDPEESVILDIGSAAEMRTEVDGRIEDARRRGASSQLVVTEAELRALAVDAIAASERGEDWVRVVREVSAEIEDGTVEVGASVDIDSLERSGLVEADDLDRVLDILPMLRGRELYVGFRGVPGVVDGELALVEGAQVKIGFLTLPIDEVAERFGFATDKLYSSSLALDLDALVVEEVRALEGELALEVRAP